MTKQELLEISKPLICNTEVAKAFADSRKTQTRRLTKGDKTRYKTGDILWIREPARVEITFVKDGVDMMDYRYLSGGGTHRIKIPKKHLLKQWVDNKRGVPNGCIKEMARMFYRVKDVRVEWLQNISIGDILNEGIALKNIDTIVDLNIIDFSKKAHEDLGCVEIAVRNSFAELWNSTTRQKMGR